MARARLAVAVAIVGAALLASVVTATPSEAAVTATACLVGLVANLWGVVRAVPPAWQPTWLASWSWAQDRDYPDYSWISAHVCRGDVVVTDSWIAATAMAQGIPVVTQDADYVDVPGLAVIRL